MTFHPIFNLGIEACFLVIVVINVYKSFIMFETYLSIQMVQLWFTINLFCCKFSSLNIYHLNANSFMESIIYFSTQGSQLALISFKVVSFLAQVFSVEYNCVILNSIVAKMPFITFYQLQSVTMHYIITAILIAFTSFELKHCELFWILFPYLY